MADDLKNKTVKGVYWSFVEQVLTRGANFIIGIILARLLNPTDYGLVGMLSVFICVSQIFIDGGLTTALIREKDASDADYSTAYFVNFSLSVVFYFILFFSAPIIADFYEQPLLKPLLRVVSLTLIISALSSVHNTLLSKRVDFKSKTIISIATSLSSDFLTALEMSVAFDVSSCKQTSCDSTFAMDDEAFSMRPKASEKNALALSISRSTRL